jgi:hypothetical protein
MLALAPALAVACCAWAKEVVAVINVNAIAAKALFRTGCIISQSALFNRYESDN